MSELINNAEYRKKTLKSLILKLHDGVNPEQVRAELLKTLQHIPYGEVVEVEQELIQEGLPEEEVLRLCDIHGEVLHGAIDTSDAQEIPEGHPIDVFYKENEALRTVAEKFHAMLLNLTHISPEDFEQYVFGMRSLLNELMDVDKHYQRKEYLVFPFLEKKGITGPPKVMWGKHDEIRAQLKAAIEILQTPTVTKQDIIDATDILFEPCIQGLMDMTLKEEEILFPMCMDELTTEDWWHVHTQTLEIGFTLYDPQIDWKPEGFVHEETTTSQSHNGTIQLPSGSFTAQEILAILNTLPVDMTFVDKDDKVKYFSQGPHRIFTRSRAIINRDVRLCQPPSSAHIVEKILDDFKSGKASHAPFWIQMKDKFIHIEYYALRNEQGEYLGTLEISQDLTALRKLEGEQRILSYSQQK